MASVFHAHEEDRTKKKYIKIAHFSELYVGRFTNRFIFFINNSVFSFFFSVVCLSHFISFFNILNFLPAFPTCYVRFFFPSSIELSDEIYLIYHKCKLQKDKNWFFHLKNVYRTKCIKKLIIYNLNIETDILRYRIKSAVFFFIVFTEQSILQHFSMEFY